MDLGDVNVWGLALGLVWRGFVLVVLTAMAVVPFGWFLRVADNHTPVCPAWRAGE